MKSKRTIVLVMTATLMLSTSQVFAKEVNNTEVNKATNVSDKLNKGAKVAALSENNKANISQEEAKKISKRVAKDYFDIEIDDKKLKCNIEFTDNRYEGRNEKVWNISWYDSNGESSGLNLHVSLDGNTGKIIAINKFQDFNPSKGEGSIAKFTKEQAAQVAEAFLNKINPENFKETVIAKDENEDKYFKGPIYSFKYNRTVNKILFTNNNIRVSVDGRTGKITSYEINWEENLKTPDKSKAMDAKDAEGVFNKNLKMELNYTGYVKNPSNSEEIVNKLVYTPDSSTPIIIDAESGKTLNWNGKYLENIKTRNITKEQKDEIIKNAKDVTSFSDPISSERAEQVLKNTLKNLYGDIYEIKSINYDENSRGFASNSVKSWSCSFEKKDKTNSFGPPEGHIAINALTEQLINLDRFDFNENQKEKFQPKINWEQAYDKAIQFIAKNCPEKIKDIGTEQRDIDLYRSVYDMNNRYINFNFERRINDIPLRSIYQNNGIQIAFDTKTGEITHFSCMWDDKAEVPTVLKTITKEEAKEKFLNANKPQLMYLVPSKEKDIDSKPETKLVYSIMNLDNYLPNVPSSIDAVTGLKLNAFGEDAQNNNDNFKDKIKGSSVEKEALILADQGVIETKDFNLESKLTRLQLVKIIVNAKGFNAYDRGMSKLNFTGGVGKEDSTDYKYIQFAVKYGIVEDNKKDFKGNELVTREELAKSLVKLSGYEKIANTKGILGLPYKDADSISDDKKGYVSLASGLKFIEANENGQIRPKDNVTMKELIKAVYTCLR